MNNYHLGDITHWLITDLYSNKVLGQSDIDMAVLEIKNNLQAYVQSNIGPDDHSSLTIHIYTNDKVPFLYHLTADLTVTSGNPAALGVPQVPPHPPGPPIIDNQYLHPVPYKYSLVSAVANVFTQNKELGFNKAVATNLKSIGYM
jgi:hypothetical protein